MEDVVCAQYGSKHSMGIIPLIPAAVLEGAVTPVFLGRKMRHREVKELAQGYKACKWQSWDSNADDVGPLRTCS